MAHAVHRLARLSHRLLWWTPLAARPRLPPDHPRRWPRSSDDLDGLAGARDLPTLLEQVQAAVSYVDAHHHIWPHARPAVARPGRWSRASSAPTSRCAARLHGRGVHRRRHARTASASRSTCRPTGRSSARSTRSAGSTSSTSAPAGRTRSSARPTCSTPNALRDARGAGRGDAADARHAPAAALARAPSSSASQPAPDRDARRRRSTRTSSCSPSSARSSSCRSSRTSWPYATQLVARPPGRHVRADPRRHADRRASRGARRCARWRAYPNVYVKLSGQGTFIHRVDPDLIARRSPTRCSTRSDPSARCSAPTSRSKASGPTSLA